MMCKMFGKSLKGFVMTWYYGLKPSSIESFGDLSKTFLGQFAFSMKAKMELNHLFYVIQCREETLRSYTQHFNNEMLEVTNCHESMAIQALRSGQVNGTPFYDSLTMRTPMKMVDVLS